MRALLTAWLLPALIALVAFAPSRTEAQEPHGASADPAPPLVVVRPLGHVGAAHLRHACRAVLDQYPVRCEIGDSRHVLHHVDAWDADRGQMDARKALDRLFATRVPDALVELNITALDMFEGDKPYVFGLASLTDRVAIVSLSRVADDPVRPGPLTVIRMKKLVLHEVGHALGLPHHDDTSCVMRQDPTPASLDTAPDRLCDACHERLVRRTNLLAYPGQIALDRVRGHLVRGQTEEARKTVVQSLFDIPRDTGLLNRFAVAFIETGHWNEAVSLLDLALKSDPEFAEAHVNRGVALQMRGRNGDLGGAIAHFARAIELRPEWGTVSAHLETLRDERARAQGPTRR